MQATAAVDTADEPPSLLWGLDPVFSAFARLYIKDILQMRESIQVPGIFFYNSHPISKVEVLGTVVYKREREHFFCYGVDDGTGVINCMCWKKDLWKDQGDPAGGAVSSDEASGVFHPVAELQKLRQAQQSVCRLEIGELLRVRGPVNTSRLWQQREIKASTYYKVKDPVMAVQIGWMMEVPQLYTQCYDKPLQLRANNTGDLAGSYLTRATHILKDFFKQKTVSRFRFYDVLDLLEPLSSKTKNTTADQEPVAGPSTSRELRQLLKEALQVLQDEGAVFLKVISPDQLYHVTEQDKDLHMAITNIIREHCRREQYAEKGCHILHILSVVRTHYSPNMSRAALELGLRMLECNSDIISTCLNYYTTL